MSRRCPSCKRQALRLRSRTDDFRCTACGEAFSRSDVDEAEEEAEADHELEEIEEELDVAEGGVPKRCPSCGRNAIKPRTRTGDYKCGACAEVFSKAYFRQDEVDPAEPVEENRCPECGKRSLSPRVRTNDFRCASCNTTFEHAEVRAHQAREYERRLLVLFRRFCNRVIPPAPVKHDPEPVEADPGCGTGLLSLMGIGAGIYLGHYQLHLGTLATVGVSFGCFVVALFAPIFILNAAASRQSAARQAEADALFRREVCEFDEWKKAEPDLAKLRTTGEPSSLYDDEGQPSPVLDVFGRAMKRHGNSSERTLFAQLRREIETRRAVPQEGSYRESS